MNNIYVCHIATAIFFAGTKDECINYQAAMTYNTSSWRISALEAYGDACYIDGYDNGYDCGYDQGQD